MRPDRAPARACAGRGRSRIRKREARKHAAGLRPRGRQAGVGGDRGSGRGDEVAIRSQRADQTLPQSSGSATQPPVEARKDERLCAVPRERLSGREMHQPRSARTISEIVGPDP